MTSGRADNSRLGNLAHGSGLRWLRRLVCGMTFGLATSGGLSQVIAPPVALTPEQVGRDPAWRVHRFAKVRASKDWIVKTRLRVASRSPGDELLAMPCCTVLASKDQYEERPKTIFEDRVPRSGLDGVEHQWIVLPLVTSNAGQTIDVTTLRTRTQLDCDYPEIIPTFVATPSGMQREFGWKFTGPDLPKRPRFNGWGYADLDVEYAATLRDVRFDRKGLAQIPWPKGRPAAYPPEAMGVFEPQAYLDFAPQATGIVRPLDDKRVDAMVAEIARRARLSLRERTLPPSETACRIADVVFKQMKRRGDGTRDVGSPGQRVRTQIQRVPSGGPVPPRSAIGPLRDPDTFAGFEVRDVLTVWNAGNASQPERAAVLVAALREFEIPARLMLGVRLDQSNRDELLNPRKGIEVTQETKVLPAVAPTGPDDPDCPNMPGRPELLEVRTTQVSTPATLVAWVEFGLYDADEREQRMVWVPIDPGTGGGDWEFGELENAENVIAVATNFWPSGIKFVGRANDSLADFGDRMQYWDHTRTNWHLPGGLFGMQSAAPVFTVCDFEWRVWGRKTSAREFRDYVRERSVPWPPENANPSPDPSTPATDKP